ncbi:MbnP family protein [Pseudotenacibaculum sp. MALMAid0570]|uniref:MbnP family protein n=1 Tax=Pseudotenacibaculum sp. MALMAid0570 TaxID=3143938 RepID=UPI0032DEA4FC
MKNKLLLFLCCITVFCCCSSNDDVIVSPVSIVFNFNHTWQTTDVTNADFNDIKFTNENGEQLSIERLRYLISDIVLTHESGTVTTLEGYVLVDVTNNENLSFTTAASILPGNYTNVTFRFGFSDDDNTDGVYQDLNTANFNVPGMLGGGYHYMQFDGKYIDNTTAEALFNFHAIRAVDTTDPNNLQFEDTSFVVSLGAVTVQGATTINVGVDLYNWFSNPNLWDLNTLNTGLMMNFSAQQMISANGSNVFSLVGVTQ